MTIPYNTSTAPTQSKLDSHKLTENKKMEKQNETQQTKDWLKKEQEELDQNKFDGEQLPALKLEDGKLTEFEVDFSKEFDKWKDPDSGVVKKIIPVLHEGEKKCFWLSTKNPTYSEIIKLGATGQTKFKILRTGQKQHTRYNLVE